eukprot:TRINITY_DN5456_c0_g4_i1.p1 TRINITY_DN5456_c0_g4~~TRINITY_DN5456_c0_g4_i1.p1  ORF type:complete len:242 (-),score=45.97 TRINITY_DN5456_c0_g4_i1:715-1440(-)
MMQKELDKLSFTPIPKKNRSRISNIEANNDLLKETASSAMKKRKKSSDAGNSVVLMLGKNSRHYYVRNTSVLLDCSRHSASSEQPTYKPQINPISRAIVKSRREEVFKENDAQTQYENALRSIGTQLESCIRDIEGEGVSYEGLCELLASLRREGSAEVEEVAGELWSLLKPIEGRASKAEVYDLIIILLGARVLNSSITKDLFHEYLRKQKLNFDNEGMVVFKLDRGNRCPIGCYEGILQ